MRLFGGSILTLGCVLAATAQETFSVTGAQVDSQAKDVPLRKNINELGSNRGPQWDLYIRALAVMQAEDSSKPLSYFQMMGIHGRPYMEWNGGGAQRTDEWQGYCPHGEKLFLSWHRAYILLYEQVLVDIAKRLAQEYPQMHRSVYESAAAQLRSPFWDWGSEPWVPNATVPLKVQVNMPNGESLQGVEIDNPLATFRFSDKILEGEYGPFDSQNRPQVYRCLPPDSYPDSANDRLAARPYKQWVYECFTYAQSFADFASTGDSGISLEQIHNAIHWDASCEEQFLSSDLSAFDPLFMLHHTNVDRLWAYWQAISPEDGSFEHPYTGGSRYSTPRGTNISPESPLNPFFQSEDEFHTSKSVEHIKGLGYSYQGLEYWEKSPAQMRRAANRIVNQLYSSDLSSPGGLASRSINPMTKYFATIRIDVTEVPRPCVVELYVCGHQAGNLVVMEQPQMGHIYGTLPLNNVLEFCDVGDDSIESTIQSILSSVEVAVVRRGGDRIDLESLSGLKIEIEDVSVIPSTAEDELPTYTTPRRRPVVPGDVSLSTGV